MKKKINYYVYAVVTIVIGTLAGLLIFEGGYRTYLLIEKPLSIVTPIGKMLNPNGSGPYRGGYVSLDEHALRNAFDRERLERKYRVMVVGDSLTFGTGVNDDEVLTHHLNRIYADDQIGFANVARPGWDTEHLRGLSMGYWKINRPIHGIVWIYYINDARTNVRYSPPVTGRVLEIRKPPHFWLGIESALWPHMKSPVLIGNLLSKFSDTQENQAQPTTGWKGYYETCLRSYRRGSASAQIEERYLKEVVGFVRKAGVPLWFVLAPATDQFADGRTNPQDFVKGILAREGIPILDLMDAMRELGDDVTSLYLRGDHGHWNPAGHRFVAEQIAQFAKFRHALD